MLELIEALGTSANALGGERVRLATKGTIPRADLLQELKEQHPQVNLNWLVTGEGAMFLTQQKSPSAEPEETAVALRNNNRLLDQLLNRVDALTKAVETLARREADRSLQ